MGSDFQSPGAGFWPSASSLPWPWGLGFWLGASASLKDTGRGGFYPRTSTPRRLWGLFLYRDRRPKLYGG